MGYASALKYYLWAFFIGVVFVVSAHSVSAAPSAPSISASCVGTGLSISMSSLGATHYALRVNNTANSWDASCPTTGWPAGDVCGLTTSPFNHSYSFAGTVNYDVWAHACDSTGCSAGATHTYPSCSPPAVAPSVTTGSASGITQTSAVLNGTANANGTAGTATFMFTQSTSYPTCSGSWPWSSAIASGSAAISGTGNSNYSVTLGNISAGTTYSFCAVATNSAGTTYGAVQSFTTTAPPTYTCSGTQPSNTVMWDATSGLTAPASYTYSGSNTSAQCEFSCNSGYNWNGTSCVVASCTNGAINPPTCNACNSGYTFNGTSCVVASCTNGANNPPTCNTCNSGYTWNGSSCTVPTYTCSGTQPSNTSMWDATSGLSSPASYTYSASNTGAQCEFACNSGYTWNGSSCTTPPTGSNFKICLNSCNSGFAYTGDYAPPSPPTLPKGSEITLVACFGTPVGCTSGNTQVLSNWSEVNDTSNAIEFSTSATNTSSVKVRGVNTGTASVTATPQ